MLSSTGDGFGVVFRLVVTFSSDNASGDDLGVAFRLEAGFFSETALRFKTDFAGVFDFIRALCFVLSGEATLSDEVALCFNADLSDEIVLRFRGVFLFD